MPDCKYFEELCSASLDGELTRAEKRELDKHLAECPACAAWLEDLKLMRTAWGDIKAPLPEELHEKIMGHIIDAMPAPAPPRKRTPPVFTIIAAAAACVLLALSGAFGDLFGGLEISQPAASGNAALDGGAPEPYSMKNAPSAADAEAGSDTAPAEQEKAAAKDYSMRAIPENAAASLAVSLPEELQAYHFGFCYVAVGSDDPPALEQASLIEKDGNLYYFSIENSMSGMEKLREQLQKAGYETAQRSDIGITDDSAQLSLLIISVSQ